jgi:hypothetical protein
MAEINTMTVVSFLWHMQAEIREALNFLFATAEQIPLT